MFSIAQWPKPHWVRAFRYKYVDIDLKQGQGAYMGPLEQAGY